MRTINLILSFILFFMVSFFYAPAGFSQNIDGDKEVIITQDELEEKIREAVQEKFEEFTNQELPGLIDTEVDRRMKKNAPVQSARTLRALQKKQKEDRKKMEEQNPDLKGRIAAFPVGNSGGAWGVKFDIAPGQNGSTKGGQEGLVYNYAKITPFLRVREYGAVMSLNLRQMLKNEIIPGELREAVSDQELEAAYVYYRAIDNDQVEVLVFLGQVDEPFVRTVFDQTVFTNLNILDKYKLNTSRAIRVDLGLGLEETAIPGKVERQVWIQASAFNLDDDEGTFEDFAVRVVASLSILNRFSDFNFKPFEVWGGVAQINSGTTPNGDQEQFTDPLLSHQATVFGFKVDLVELTGKQLGHIYGEFVHRVRTGELSDQSWVIGWEGITLGAKEGERPISLGARIQRQDDDLDPISEDGDVASIGALIPLSGYNLGLRLNFGYVFNSSNEERDGQFVASYDFELVF